MGGGESKPVFPTEAQWNDYKSARAAAITKHVTDLKKEQDKHMNEDIISTLEYFDAHMAKCHDKSKIRQFFANNEASTKARSELIQYMTRRSATYVNYADTINKISESL